MPIRPVEEPHHSVVSGPDSTQGENFINRSLLYRHGLGQVAGLIDMTAAHDGNMISQ